MDLTQALAIIDAAVERSSLEIGPTDETLEALRFLWRHGIERKTLKLFHDGLSWEHPSGRWQTLNAARNRIRFVTGQR